MHIVHVIATLAAEEGGPSRAVLDMAVAMAARGHDVAIQTTDYGGAPVDVAAARQQGVRIETHPVQFPRRWKRSTALRATLERVLPDVDVVHLHSFYLYHCLITERICRKAGVPYVLRPHGTLDPFLQQRHRYRKGLIGALFQNRVTDNAAGLHFTAQEERELAQPYARGQKGFVVPSALDPSEFAALPPASHFHQRFPEMQGRRILLFMSRLNFKKGLDILIAAFAGAVAERPDLHLVIAGPDDGMQQSVEAWVAETGLEGHVTLPGMLRGEDRLAALSAAELAVLPSYSENFGYAVVEAMACGLPVLISDRVNIWREVQAAEAGVVCAADRDAVTRAMIAMLDEPQKNRQRGANGKALVERLYSPAAVGAQIERMYADVIAGRQSSAG